MCINIFLHILPTLIYMCHKKNRHPGCRRRLGNISKAAHFPEHLKDQNYQPFQPSTMSRPTRRRTADTPVAAPVAPAAAPTTALAAFARPSGRFDAFVDMGNPMKGINLFPFLRRRQEGRALRAVGPAASLEVSRTVCETVLPRRWPREVLSPSGTTNFVSRINNG